MSQQGIVGRVMQLARANINAMIDSAEDPQKMLDQLVQDYSVHISAAEQAIAQTIANLRMIEEDQKEEAKAAQQWGKKAAAASKKADELRAAGSTQQEADTFDDLARVALERQMAAESDVVTVQHTIDAQCNSGASEGSLSAPLAVVAMRVKVASASAENSTPVVLPSAPV